MEANAGRKVLSKMWEFFNVLDKPIQLSVYLDPL